MARFQISAHDACIRSVRALGRSISCSICAGVIGWPQPSQVSLRPVPAHVFSGLSRGSRPWASLAGMIFCGTAVR